MSAKHPTPTWLLLALFLAGTSALAIGTALAVASPPRAAASGEEGSDSAQADSTSPVRAAPSAPETLEAIPRPVPSEPLETSESGPLQILAGIESAWTGEDLEGLMQYFGRGRVYISLGPGGPFGGSFSRNQAYYLFQDHFAHTVTEKFQIKRTRSIDKNGRKVFAVAERVFRYNENGRRYQDKLFISLRQEGGAWVVAEIRSTL
jgi:hypothetical protein